MYIGYSIVYIDIMQFEGRVSVKRRLPQVKQGIIDDYHRSYTMKVTYDYHYI